MMVCCKEEPSLAQSNITGLIHQHQTEGQQQETNHQNNNHQNNNINHHNHNNQNSGSLHHQSSSISSSVSSASIAVHHQTFLPPNNSTSLDHLPSVGGGTRPLVNPTLPAADLSRPSAAAFEHFFKLRSLPSPPMSDQNGQQALPLTLPPSTATAPVTPALAPSSAGPGYFDLPPANNNKTHIRSAAAAAKLDQHRPTHTNRTQRSLSDLSPSNQSLLSELELTFQAFKSIILSPPQPDHALQHTKHRLITLLDQAAHTKANNTNNNTNSSLIITQQQHHQPHSINNTSTSALFHSSHPHPHTQQVSSASTATSPSSGCYITHPPPSSSSSASSIAATGASHTSPAHTRLPPSAATHRQSFLPDLDKKRSRDRILDDEDHPPLKTPRPNDASIIPSSGSVLPSRRSSLVQPPSNAAQNDPLPHPINTITNLVTPSKSELPPSAPPQHRPPAYPPSPNTMLPLIQAYPNFPTPLMTPIEPPISSSLSLQSAPPLAQPGCSHAHPPSNPVPSKSDLINSTNVCLSSPNHLSDNILARDSLPLLEPGAEQNKTTLKIKSLRSMASNMALPPPSALISPPSTLQFDAGQASTAAGLSRSGLEEVVDLGLSSSASSNASSSLFSPTCLDTPHNQDGGRLSKLPTIPSGGECELIGSEYSNMLLEASMSDHRLMSNGSYQVNSRPGAMIEQHEHDSNTPTLESTASLIENYLSSTTTPVTQFPQSSFSQPMMIDSLQPGETIAHYGFPPGHQQLQQQQQQQQQILQQHHLHEQQQHILPQHHQQLRHPQDQLINQSLTGGFDLSADPRYFAASVASQQEPSRPRSPGLDKQHQLRAMGGCALGQSSTDPLKGSRNRSLTQSSMGIQPLDEMANLGDSYPSTPSSPCSNYSSNSKKDVKVARRTSPPVNKQMGAASAGVSQELEAQFEPIFTKWLGRLCSDLDMKDSKGEMIHQTLMARKMKRLEESIDYRPFKFRIQAFTNSFFEELVRNGFEEKDLSIKKVRQYLWSQPCISRFNEEGKKAKSKGNHVWHIEAQKMMNGQWNFLRFERKIIGPRSEIIYEGIPWTWPVKVWDPQCSTQNIHVEYKFEGLPQFLEFDGNEINGLAFSEHVGMRFYVRVDGSISINSKKYQVTLDVQLEVRSREEIGMLFSLASCAFFVNDQEY